MRPLLSRRRTLPALLAAAAVTTIVTAAPSPAHAADEITCKSTATVWAVRTNAELQMHHHNEPETGVDSWIPNKHNGNAWPESTWAGPDGRMYYLHAGTGTLERHRWLGTTWENEGVSKPVRDNMGYFADPANGKRFTIDSTGAFYMVEQSGELWRRTYDENAGTWNSVAIDSDWNRYDAIFAAGEGVLWAREPNGAMFRFRYHAGSQRWLQHRLPITGIAWEQYKHLTSAGADVIYAIRKSDNAIVWYRYHESIGHLTPGTHAGYWWTDSATAVAAPDGCRRVDEPSPVRPGIGAPDRSAKAALLRTSDGHLQYAYVDPDGRAVTAKVTDIYNTTPNGFAALPGESDFTGTPAIAETTNSNPQILAQGADTDARSFDQAANGNWNAPTNNYGRMLTAPQAVRTSDNRVTYVALAYDGNVWAKWQHQAGGTVYPWRPLTTQPVTNTKHFTVTTVGTAIHMVALDAAGYQCKITVTPGDIGGWSCSGQSSESTAAVVPMPGNTLQVFDRRSDGKVYMARTNADGTMPVTWTALPGTLPGGAVAVGVPAALLAPNGTLQVVVRASDGHVYRSGQTASGGTQWHEWTEVTGYTVETAVDPTVSLAQDTWVIAFRTPSATPQLWRFAPTTAAGSGAFQHVRLGG